MKSKALQYYSTVMKRNDYDLNSKEVKELLENSVTNVGYSIVSEEWWTHSNEYFQLHFVSKFKNTEIIDMFNLYKPPTNLTDEEIEEQCFGSEFYTYFDYSPKCQNTKCKYYRGDYNGWCGYSDWADACIVDTVYNILLAFDIGGWSAIDELKPQFDKRVINHISKQLPTDYIGIKEEKLYNKEAKKMADIFFEKLSKLNEDDDIFVYWDGDRSENGFGTMYVNDESKHQAQNVTTLYEAYKFALLINASNFDYVASDELVKEFGEQLLKLVDEEFYKINVWEYIDDIKDDFKTLTGIELGIDEKRHIISAMADVVEKNSVHIVGTHSYIAKLLSDYIRGDKKNNIKGCDNPIIIELAESYLRTDDYDLYKFKNALHNTEKGRKIGINGSLWINSAKYEYVDYIVITMEEVEIYSKNYMIGSIERNKINTIEEQHYPTAIYNLKEILDFDITKIGDF